MKTMTPRGMLANAMKVFAMRTTKVQELRSSRMKRIMKRLRAKRKNWMMLLTKMKKQNHCLAGGA